MSVGAAAVYLTDMAVLGFTQSTTAANSSGRQAFPATVRGLSCRVGLRAARERREGRTDKEGREEVRHVGEENW